MRRILRIIMLMVGSALLMAGVLAPASAPTTLAQGVPPRPTLTPVPPTATAATGPTATPRRSDSPRATATPLGRITGTVIDLTTGAPVPGVAVQVGDSMVTSDASGNYDRNGLAAGSYDVQLRLTAGQGEPAQGVITVGLGPGETVVQHLALRSVPPGASAADPAAGPGPAAPPDAATTPPPAQLPQTAGRGGPQGLLIALGLALVGAGLCLRRRTA